MKLSGKTVLITGGSKGIGEACAIAFASEGANIIINYANDESAADSVAQKIEEFGGKSLVVKADITDQKQVDEMFNQIKQEFPSIDVLINNAGVFDENDGPDNMQAFEKVFEADFVAQVNITNQVRQIMQVGKIVFISSIHGKLGHGSPRSIAYASAKAALNSYMKNLAKAVAPDILVNSIAPGRTKTPMWGEMDKAYMDEMADGQLINRWIQPDEIADGAVFLAKNDAVCGEILVIDGGMSLKVLG